MSLKLKVILGVLVMGAGIAIVSVGGSALSKLSALTKQSVATIGSGTVLVPTADDTDHDGISDADEGKYDTDPNKADTDGDGYLDGEEIMSGYNPLIADAAKETEQKKNADNLTVSYFTNLTDGYLAGDLDPTKTDATGYSTNADVLTYGSMKIAETTKVDAAASVRTVIYANPSEADITDYLNEVYRWMSYIPMQNRYLDDAEAATSPKGFADRMGSWKALATIMLSVRNHLGTMSVPKQFVSFHESTMKALAEGIDVYGAMGRMNDDPMRAMVKLDNLEGALTDLAVAGAQLNAMLTQNHINKQVHPYFNVPSATP